MAEKKTDDKKKKEDKGWEISNKIVAPVLTLIIFGLAFLFMKIDYDTMKNVRKSENAPVVVAEQVETELIF